MREHVSLLLLFVLALFLSSSVRAGIVSYVIYIYLRVHHCML